MMLPLGSIMASGWGSIYLRRRVVSRCRAQDKHLDMCVSHEGRMNRDWMTCASVSCSTEAFPVRGSLKWYSMSSSGAEHRGVTSDFLWSFHPVRRDEW
jgi:hypothetical protein